MLIEHSAELLWLWISDGDAGAYVNKVILLQLPNLVVRSGRSKWLACSLKRATSGCVCSTPGLQTRRRPPRKSCSSAFFLGSQTPSASHMLQCRYRVSGHSHPGFIKCAEPMSQSPSAMSCQHVPPHHHSKRQDCSLGVRLRP